MAHRRNKIPAQLVEDEEYQLRFEKTAGIDVAKASGVVCSRVPREGAPGRFTTKAWPVDATTNAILELADHLSGLQIEKVVLESTSDYWRPFFYLLEAAGLHVELVNARDVKNAPGRPKTDLLTELREGLGQVSGRMGTLVVTVADRDDRRGSAAGSVAAGGAAGRVA